LVAKLIEISCNKFWDFVLERSKFDLSGSQRYMNFNKVLISIVIFSFLIGVYSVNAYVMSSPNYRIRSDSINIGGTRQTSASYRMEDTIGEIASDESASASYRLKAGYQQMQEVYISISAPADVTMNPAIAGVTGGTGDGQASWTVITDNPAGYTLAIKASISPALECSSGGCSVGIDSFADYTPTTVGVPDYDWLIAPADSEFGFTPEGVHIVQKYRDDGNACNTGINDTINACWYNFSTSDENIASSSSSNHPSGTSTTVKFKAQSGSSHLQVAGIYSATITATATAN